MAALSVTTLVTASQEPPAGQIPVGRGRAGGASPPARTGSSVIAGRVVESASTSAVPSAVVTITGAGAAPQRVQVDASGRFLFRDLPNGEFNIVAAKPGYFGGQAGQRLPGGPSRPVALGDGERLTDLTLRLWKAGAIGGAVLDEAGEPVVGVKVTLAERRLVNGQRRIASGQLSVVATDDRGMYRFGAVAPGEYLVFARTSEDEIARGLMSLVMGDPGVVVPFAMKAMNGRPEDLLSFENALRVYPPTFHPSATLPSGASPIAIQSGEIRLGVDIRIRLVPLRRLAGTFTGLPATPQGNPNPQVRLVLHDPDAGDFDITGAMMPTDTSNGRFSFIAVPAGQYLLRAYRPPRLSGPPPTVAPGTPAGRGRGTGPPPLPTEPVYWASKPIAVGSEDTANVALALRAGSVMSGRVEFDGSALRPDKDQLARVLVTVVPEMQTSFGLMLRGAVDAEGAFRTASLPPGKYRLRVSPVGAWQPRSAIVEGRDVLDEAIDLGTTDVTDVVITFTDRPLGTINGTVRSAQGAPDPEALVAIFPADPRLRTDFSGSGRRMRLARTTASGQYAIPSLPPGQYLIAAGGDELFDTWLEPAALQALARRATRVDIAEGAQNRDLKNGSVR
jgi:protocatechuate 3,4-dioxygenase beta subunit